MADRHESESGELGTMRLFEEYHARVFPNETDRRRFDSNDSSVLMTSRLSSLRCRAIAVALAALFAVPAAGQAPDPDGGIPRTPDGRPDLQGVWTNASIVALGSNGLRDKATLAAGTRSVVDGMIRHRVERLVVLSAAGAGESWRKIPWLARLLS